MYFHARSTGIVGSGGGKRRKRGIGLVAAQSGRDRMKAVGE